ncbi:replication-associated recombination protein A [Flavobacteriaceae bacterium]|nr:replication-associated recombination protein A [Flavobacteriaceae bacterium]MDB4128771.1 replication-associated recombination protein A [Flavobacteriaceae bacterium]MDB4612263.1 replication-associated recombination protein A [Flavobacteriaceae bacterium]MDC0103156.1 replication-associated recombination protein A [Flavobacteriaceae bacterium]MDC3367977.1 replication-associated recombination protein A [Flavobacteriaceae bacterium]|tara:strand:- start:20218 stop:21495 length:1278 start_codon:yes stop_codon:yes gene_type:complete
MNTPLAERMRPKSLGEYFGQDHLVGPKGSLTQMISNGVFPSLIFWGPPGTGKTTLAQLLALEKERPFYQLSAINAGVKEIREIISKAEHSGGLFSGKSPILFIDEIHRFSKSQQDSLLNAVEKGIITLIGATTENPSFEVINALLSRCQVYVLNTLKKEDLEKILNHALEKDSIIKEYKIQLKETEALIELAGGDARKLLSLLELVIQAKSKEKLILTNDLVFETVQTNSVLFDKNGDFHYDIVSAFIKSIRGSDPNGAIYWLARMIEGGEDIGFIARRMLILAAEDIGIANPTALVLANSTFQAVNSVGYPEGRILLSECALYLATSPKSNTAYKAIGAAQEKVRQTGNLPVPLHLRNAPTKLMKEMGYGEDYKYAHDFQNQFVDQEFLPEKIKGTTLYSPGNNSKENSIREFLKLRWKKKYGY